MTEAPRQTPTPWSRLSGAIGDSLDAKCLLIAAVGLAIASAGEALIDLPSPSRSSVADDFLPALEEIRDDPWGVVGSAASLLATPVRSVASSWLETLRLGGGNAAWFHAAANVVWGLIVWSLFGAAIGRIAVVRAADEVETVGLRDALRFAASRALSLLAAPLGPMVAAGLLGGLCAAVGLLFRADGGWLVELGGVLSILALLAGLAMTLLLAGLALGWPLMVMTVSAEGEDAFDAVSRSYSYVGHRPLKYTASVAILAAVGLVAALVVMAGAGAIEHLAEWGLALGARDDDVVGLFGPFSRNAPARLWGRGLRWLVVAWSYSYFWAAAARLYLLLRLDVDGAPWHAVYRPSADQARPEAQAGAELS